MVFVIVVETQAAVLTRAESVQRAVGCDEGGMVLAEDYFGDTVFEVGDEGWFGDHAGHVLGGLVAEAVGF